MASSIDLPTASYQPNAALRWNKTSRGHGFKLRHRSLRLLQGKAAHSMRLPISWNKLQIGIANAPTLDTFK